MNQNEKDRIIKQINTLNDVLANLKKLDQTNSRVSLQIQLISDQITDYYLELEDANQYIPWRKRIYNDYIKSKIVMINIALIFFELLNAFTDVFSKSNSEHLRLLAIAIPVITIYLRTKST